MVTKTETIPLIGHKIAQIRAMTPEEIEQEGWDGLMGHQDPAVIILDNGVRIYPAADSEGNGPGCLYGSLGKKHFHIFGKDQ